jgi:hypothetical protein
MVSTLIVFSLNGVCVRETHYHLIDLSYVQRAYQLCCRLLTLKRKIEGIRVSSSAPRINRLFFADDSLILMKATRAAARVLKNILNIYELASGQMINKDKSSILFSPNTSSTTRQQIKAIMSINQEAKNDRYLGLRVSVGKAKKRTFE